MTFKPEEVTGHPLDNVVLLLTETLSYLLAVVTPGLLLSQIVKANCDVSSAE